MFFIPFWYFLYTSSCLPTAGEKICWKNQNVHHFQLLCHIFPYTLTWEFKHRIFKQCSTSIWKLSPFEPSLLGSQLFIQYVKTKIAWRVKFLQNSGRASQLYGLASDVTCTMDESNAIGVDDMPWVPTPRTLPTLCSGFLQNSGRAPRL
jgi:hypothetical protein